jgi:hypothetical protein
VAAYGLLLVPVAGFAWYAQTHGPNEEERERRVREYERRQRSPQQRRVVNTGRPVGATPGRTAVVNRAAGSDGDGDACSDAETVVETNMTVADVIRRAAEGNADEDEETWRALIKGGRDDRRNYALTAKEKEELEKIVKQENEEGTATTRDSDVNDGETTEEEQRKKERRRRKKKKRRKKNRTAEQEVPAQMAEGEEKRAEQRSPKNRAPLVVAASAGAVAAAAAAALVLVVGRRRD